MQIVVKTMGTLNVGSSILPLPNDNWERPVNLNYRKYYMPQGTVKWFNEKKGFGFITNEEGNDVFVHHSGIVGEGFKKLNEGDTVSFEVEQSDKGPRATGVKVV